MDDALRVEEGKPIRDVVRQRELEVIRQVVLVVLEYVAQWPLGAILAHNVPVNGKELCNCNKTPRKTRTLV